MLEENEDKGMHIICNIPLLLQDNTRCKYTLDKDTYNDLYIKLSDTKQYLLDFVRVLSQPKNVAIIRDTKFRDVDTAVNFIDKKGTEEIAWEKTLKAIRTVMVDKVTTTKEQFTKTFTHIETIKNHLSSPQVLDDRLCLFLQSIDSLSAYISNIDKQDNSNNTEYLRLNKQLQIILNKMLIANKVHSGTHSETTADIFLLLSALPSGTGCKDSHYVKTTSSKLISFTTQCKLLQRYVVYINSLLQNQPESSILSNVVTEIPDNYMGSVKTNFNLLDAVDNTKYDFNITDKYDVKVKDLLAILKKELPIYKEHTDNITSIMSKTLTDVKTDIEIVFTSLLDKLIESFTSGDIKTITYLVNVYTAVLDTIYSNVLCTLQAIIYITNKYNDVLYAANILQNILAQVDVLKPVLKNDSKNVSTARIFTLDELKKVPLE